MPGRLATCPGRPTRRRRTGVAVPAVVAAAHRSIRRTWRRGLTGNSQSERSCDDEKALAVSRARPERSSVGSPTRLWDRQCRRAKHLMRRPPWWHHGRDGDADVSSRWPTSGGLNMSEGDVTEDLPDDRHRRHEARPGQSASDREAHVRAEDAARRAQIDADLAMNALELATREGDTH